MAASDSPKHFALLVGIDLYLNDGSRKNADGDTITLNNLNGCVKDVREITRFLLQKLPRCQPSILTSSKLDGQSKPDEPPEQWPTFINIKREFDNVYEQSRPGDFFYFHFSGHGYQLDPINVSPNPNAKDPSLLTVDFCCAERAVRGWRLNQWLQRLSEKKVHIVVTLDSCHSGDAWRDSVHCRTPKGWTTVRNLPVDDETVDGIVARSTYRDGSIDESWNINPDQFTVMTACETHQRASDTTLHGQPGGAFTHALLAYLEQNQSSDLNMTYRIIRDRLANQLANQLLGQNPRVFGRDRFVFFGTEEPFTVTPLVVRLNHGQVVLPIGRVHGVHRESQFTCHSTTSVITIEGVQDFECSANVSPEVEAAIRSHDCQVIPSRWNFGKKDLSVVIDPRIDAGFTNMLRQNLSERISSTIELLQPSDSDSIGLKVCQQGHDRIDIFGPASLIGYDGPVRCLDIQGNDTTKLADQSATALAHLARFEQVLGLHEEASNETPPFTLNISADADATTPPDTKGERFRFAFKNTGESGLHLAVMVLGPGFNIQQIYPPEDSARFVPSNTTRSFTFFVTVPEQLKKDQSTGERPKHRDIFRTIVTRGRELSWKSLELPHIWNAAKIEQRSPIANARDVGGVVEEEDFALWVVDREMLTTHPE